MCALCEQRVAPDVGFPHDVSSRRIQGKTTHKKTQGPLDLCPICFLVFSGTREDSDTVSLGTARTFLYLEGDCVNGAGSCPSGLEQNAFKKPQVLSEE